MAVVVGMQDVPFFLGCDRKELMTAGSLAAWDTRTNEWADLYVTYNTGSGAVGVLFVAVTDGHGHGRSSSRITDGDDEVVKVGTVDGVPQKVDLSLRVFGVNGFVDVLVEVSTSQGAWFVRRV